MSVLDDIVPYAEWVAGALTASGYPADFSGASLVHLERFFAEQTANGQPAEDGLLATDTGARMFAAGAYLGEVIRRNVGGDWLPARDNPESEVDVELYVPDKGVCWPMQRVMKRMVFGSEDGLVTYGAELGVNVQSQEA